MDSSVRQALVNLQGLLEEGFVTKKEFETRRRAILDKATVVDSDSGKWGHDGYFAMMQNKKKSRSQRQQEQNNVRIVTVTSDHQTDLRSKLTGRQDLRAKLTGGQDLRAKLSRGGGPQATSGGIKKRDLRHKLSSRNVVQKLPEKCPW